MVISICVPTYARLDYLKIAIASALSQTYKDVEICISQDPKPDGPDLNIKDWCVGKALEYPNIKYNLNDQNLGLAGNWNRVVEMATGEYVVIIGDDDVLAENFIEALYVQIIKYNADVAFSNQYFIDSEGQILYELTEKLNKDYCRDELKLLHPIKNVFNNSVPISASLIRRILLLKFPYDPNLNTPELEVFLKIAAFGGIFVYIDEKLAYYRFHEQSATFSGLTMDKLLMKITEIKVPTEYESIKHNFLSPNIIPSINISLRKGDKKIAKYLLNSSYYPNNKWKIKLIQKLLLIFPSSIVKKII
jgi:glycosyltransferase involved in cell wall biosynthesis